MSKSKGYIPVAGAASVLAIFALSGPALAQTSDEGYDSQSQTTDQGYDSQSQTMESGMDTHSAMKDEAAKAATTFGVSDLSEIENWKITSGGEELGEIDRLGVDRATGEILAVVGLEGVVGVNMKEVAVPLNSLTKAGDETLSTNLTKDQLQSERDIDPWDGSYSQVLDEEATQ